MAADGGLTGSIIIVIFEENTHVFGFSWPLASRGFWPADRETPCVIDCN